MAHGEEARYQIVDEITGEVARVTPNSKFGTWREIEDFCKFNGPDERRVIVKVTCVKCNPET